MCMERHCSECRILPFSVQFSSSLSSTGIGVKRKVQGMGYYTMFISIRITPPVFHLFFESRLTGILGYTSVVFY